MHIYTYEWDIIRHIKAWNPVINDKMVGLQGRYVKWNKSGTEKHCTVSLTSKKVDIIESENRIVLETGENMRERGCGEVSQWV
jgi:hypothetical protein